MSLSIKVPEKYGYVLLTAVVGQVFTHFFLAHNVMNARKAFDVPYPNLYATPSVHKFAEEFNRVQRGHQNYVENLPLFLVLALIGGLKHPIRVAVSSVVYSVGSILYFKGYADTTLDVKTARYMKGGFIKQAGYFTVFGTSISLIGSMCGWW